MAQRRWLGAEESKACAAPWCWLKDPETVQYVWVVDHQHVSERSVQMADEMVQTVLVG